MADNAQPGFQYVKLPDGSYGKFAGNAPDEQISAQIAKDFPGVIAAQSGTHSAAPQTFDEKYVAPQMAPPNEGLGHHIMRGASNFGGGVIGAVTAPFEDPFKTLAGIGGLITGPFEEMAKPGSSEYSDMARSLKEHPEEGIESGLGNLAGGAIIGGMADEAGNALPSAVRAGRTLQKVRAAADQVPVSFTKSAPEFERFEDLTQAGGRRSKPFTQLGKRMQPGEPPVNFPEARDFYSNISDATNSTTLQKLMGRGMKPVMRRQGVLARRAMSGDLTDAASQVGMGDEYTNAMKEYANAMRIKKYIRGAALLGAGEAARRTGLLGNWIHRTALQQ